ncbi:zona pellucida sperm-binding protein 3-like isoform X2 [Polyodon spathula]|uniref:zona pellucida sperm-binding protein 3-like isoform X2 n=1 Tax=Polyodon spathula TaxID=7913 RepID=UPI001B7EC4DD|nr:zona pellucida sperm-binding protein 3-like isoform X2 [Polyodon spathula]
MGIMNDDFSAPRTSSLFFLGSPINIAAAVKQQFHMPLMVYMEACVAASTPELSPSSQTYPLITNHGLCWILYRPTSPSQRMCTGATQTGK